nr:MAG TPA: hypothetical protein [Caudoviricetes sp.]
MPQKRAERHLSRVFTPLWLHGYPNQEALKRFK